MWKQLGDLRFIIATTVCKVAELVAFEEDQRDRPPHVSWRQKHSICVVKLLQSVQPLLA